ncbi:MAG: hypothetical protein WCR47_08420 [Desulfoplanes sp.]
MNPFFISTIIKTIWGLKRTCPQCNHSQIVPADKKFETVCCAHCGADIPPKKHLPGD